MSIQTDWFHILIIFCLLCWSYDVLAQKQYKDSLSKKSFKSFDCSAKTSLWSVHEYVSIWGTHSSIFVPIPLLLGLPYQAILMSYFLMCAGAVHVRWFLISVGFFLFYVSCLFTCSKIKTNCWVTSWCAHCRQNIFRLAKSYICKYLLVHCTAWLLSDVHRWAKTFSRS